MQSNINSLTSDIIYKSPVIYRVNLPRLCNLQSGMLLGQAEANVRKLRF